MQFKLKCSDLRLWLGICSFDKSDLRKVISIDHKRQRSQTLRTPAIVQQITVTKSLLNKKASFDINVCYYRNKYKKSKVLGNYNR